MDVNIEELEQRFRVLHEYVKHSISPSRYIHSKNVAELSARLCKRFGIALWKGYLAGLAHDMVKELASQELTKLAETYNLTIEAHEKENPDFLHGKVASGLLRDRFDVSDSDILEAVANHICGRRGMGVLAKIVYLADFLEPGRTFLDSAVREEVLGGDLDSMMFFVSESILNDLKKRGRTVVLHTEELYLEAKKRIRS